MNPSKSGSFIPPLLKQSTLDNIVRGITQSPGAVTLHKIAIAFNMTLAEFLDFDELNLYSFEDNE